LNLSKFLGFLSNSKPQLSR